MSDLSSNQYMLRYMRLDDINRVFEIDQQSFALPWQPRSYHYEINDNATAHMVILETASNAPKSGGLFGFLRLNKPLPTVTVGYGGLWLIAGEAHISTIAVAPESRGKGLGEVLLNGMLGRVLALRAEYCVLEVREHNPTAQALYTKYGFTVVGRRKNYYRDNHEDALLMHVGRFDAAYRERFESLTVALQARITYEDRLQSSDPRGRTG